MKYKKTVIILLLVSIIFIVGGIIIKYIEENKPFDSSFIKDTEIGSSIIKKLKNSKLIEQYKEEGYEIKVQNVTSTIAIHIKKDKQLILRFSLEDDYLVTSYQEDELKYKIITFVIASLESDPEKVDRILDNNILELLTKENHGVEIKDNKIYIYYNNLNVTNFNMNLEED